MNLSKNPKKFFNTKDGWITVDRPEKKFSFLESKINYEKKEKFETIQNCTDYWDNIKEKYRYNHLYRKRILKIEKEVFESVKGDKTKMTQLLESEGEIKAQYANTSHYRENRGKGIQEEVNGKREEIIEEQSLEEVDEMPEQVVEEDVLNQIKKCLINSSIKDEDGTVAEGIEFSNDAVQPEDMSKRRCSHIVERDCRKLFTVPECMEPEPKLLEEESFEEPLSTFDSCMKELHELENVVESNILEEVEGSIKEEDDPWCRFKRYQREEYGYAELEYCPDKEEGKSPEESSGEKKDIYKEIIDNIINREVNVKGAKMKIKRVIKQYDNIMENVRSVNIILKGENGEYLKGIRLKKDKGSEIDEGEFIKQVLDNLAGEWTAIGAFLRQLAIPTASHEPIQTTKKIIRSSQLHSVNSQLSKNVEQMISEILNQINNNDYEENNTHELEVQLHLNRTKKVNKTFASSRLTVDQQQTVTQVNFREKIKSNIHKDRKNKVLSKVTVTKRDLTVLPSKESSENKLSESIDINDCNCKVTMQNDFAEDKNLKPPGQTYSRNLVEFISGGKYAGSWNYLGMEGCGVYKSPGGTMIDGQMIDGVFHGPATVYLPNGIIMSVHFNQGNIHSPEITFGDGLVYKSKNWDYLKNPNSKDESIRSPIFDRKIPEGHYDTGEGFYNPTTKLLYHPVTMVPIRSVSEREEKWILSSCRAANPKCVSLEEHLNETTDILREKLSKKTRKIPEEPTPEELCNTLKKIHLIRESKSQWSSPDRFIDLDKTSRPIEQLWDDIKEITASQKANIGVPFSYEKAIEYTCQDERKKKELIT